MKIVAAILAGMGLSAGTDICLPDVHTTFVHTYKDRIHMEHGHHPEEYKQGDHLKMFWDAKAKKSLVWVHDDNDHDRDPAKGMLFDYDKQQAWGWDWFNNTAHRCRTEKFDRPMEKVCISTGATKKGSGTLGEDFKVDAYRHFEVNKTAQVEFDVDTIVEAGSTSKPVQQRRMGRSVRVGGFFETIEWMDFTEDPIPASQFAVPEGCPK